MESETELVIELAGQTRAEKWVLMWVMMLGTL